MQTALLPPLLLPFLLPFHPSVVEETPLDRAVRTGMVSVSAHGNGGHSGACLTVRLENLSAQPMRTTIPAGWLMRNSDPDAQDLMIVDHVPVELAPRASHSVACRAYCVESGDRSPQQGTPFTSIGMAQPAWVKLAELLVKDDPDPHDAQAAVWAVANGHDIATISAENRALRRSVADLTGREVPWYAKTYAPPTEEGRVFSDSAASVQGEVGFTLNTHGRVTALIHDAHGRLVYTIGKPRHLGPGSYSMEISVTVRGWPKGAYTVSYYLDDSRLLKRLPFVV